MSLVNNSLAYEPTKVSTKVSKSGVRVVDEMSTPRILNYLMFRHRVGLLGLSTFVLFSYTAYDKVISRIF